MPLAISTANDSAPARSEREDRGAYRVPPNSQAELPLPGWTVRLLDHHANRAHRPACLPPERHRVRPPITPRLRPTNDLNEAARADTLTTLPAQSVRVEAHGCALP